MELRTLIVRVSALMLSIAMGGCDITEPEFSSMDLEGVWQLTLTNDSEETIRFNPNGTLDIIQADLAAESCRAGTGTWSLDSTHLSVSTLFDGASEQSEHEVDMSGSNRLLVSEDDVTDEYTRLAVMPSCVDYGWGRWEGTLSAFIEGVEQSFDSNRDVTMELMEGYGGFSVMSWVEGPDSCGNPSCPQIGPRFLVSLKGPAIVEGAGMPVGAYQVDGSPDDLHYFIGKFWPDPYDAEFGFEAYELIAGSSGTFELTEIGVDRIAGTFSFTGVSLAGDSLVVSGGVVDLTYR